MGVNPWALGAKNVSSIQTNKVLKERSGWKGAHRGGDISLKVIHRVLEEAEEPCDRTLILKSNGTRYLTSGHSDCR